LLSSGEFSIPFYKCAQIYNLANLVSCFVEYKAPTLEHPLNPQQLIFRERSIIQLSGCHMLPQSYPPASSIRSTSSRPSRSTVRFSSASLLKNESLLTLNSISPLVNSGHILTPPICRQSLLWFSALLTMTPSRRAP